MRFLNLIGLTGLLLTGCQSTPSTSPEPPQIDASWKSRVGQLRYTKGERSIIGDCVFASRGADQAQLEFRAGPGFPLMRLWVAGPNAVAEGALARGRWTGPTAKAPARLRGWLALPEALKNARLRTDIPSASTGERFEVVFSR